MATAAGAGDPVLAAPPAGTRDLTSLARAAADRGLYRRAAALWTTAAELGDADAAGLLVTHLRQFSPGDTIRAARWAVGRARIEDRGTWPCCSMRCARPGPSTRWRSC